MEGHLLGPGDLWFLACYLGSWEIPNCCKGINDIISWSINGSAQRVQVCTLLIHKEWTTFLFGSWAYGWVYIISVAHTFDSGSMVWMTWIFYGSLALAHMLMRHNLCPWSLRLLLKDHGPQDLFGATFWFSDWVQNHWPSAGPSRHQNFFASMKWNPNILLVM
jgi:hypothetical protein